MSRYEPSTGEVWLTLIAGKVLGRYYRGYVDSLELDADGRVLDFGSGSGVCSRHLAQRLAPGGHLTCVDVSHRWQEVIRKQLRRYPHVDYRCGEMWTLDLPPGSYDAVFVHFVLHDIPEHEHDRILAAFARSLKDGGRVLIREPSNPGHGMLLEDMRALFERNGFVTRMCRADSVPLIGPVSDGTFVKDG